LLLPHPGNLLDHIVVDVSVGDDLATTAVGVAENNLNGLLIVRDFLLREIADEDRFSGHIVSLQLGALRVHADDVNTRGQGSLLHAASAAAS
jgi:hypothetical protein